MSGPQTPGPAVDPPAAGPGLDPRVPAAPGNGDGAVGDPANTDPRALAARLASMEVIAEELARRAGRREFERDEARRERDEALASLAAALAAIARVRALHGRTFQGVAKDVVQRGEILAALEPPGGGT